MNAAAAEMGFSLCIYSVYTAVRNNRQTIALCLDAVMTGSAAGKRFCFVCRRVGSDSCAGPGPARVKLTVKVVPSANYESRDGSTLHHYLGGRPQRRLPGRQQSCARSCD